MDVELVIVPTPVDAAARSAQLLVDAARAGADIALSGGSTPRPAYERAAEVDPDWGTASVWLADERLVPLDDERSNARLVRETLLDRLDVQPTTHFVRTELDADDAAEDYARALGNTHLDLVLLGIGPDGHTASLFPHAPALEEHERLAVAADPGLDPFVPRVTLTIPALRAAARIVFLVTGAAKAEAVRCAFAEPPSPATPASLVRSQAGTTAAVLDRAAAALLDQ